MADKFRATPLLKCNSQAEPTHLHHVRLSSREYLRTFARAAHYTCSNHGNLTVSSISSASGRATFTWLLNFVAHNRRIYFGEITVWDLRRTVVIIREGSAYY